MKSAKKQKEVEHYLYLVESTEYSGGKPMSNKEWCDRSPQYHETTFFGLLRESPQWPHRIKVNKKLLDKEEGFLAVIKYSSGDTFGSSHGHCYNVGVYESYSESEKALDNALNSNDGYKPWEGYFEALEGTETHRLKIFNTEDECKGGEDPSGKHKRY